MLHIKTKSKKYPLSLLLHKKELLDLFHMRLHKLYGMTHLLQDLHNVNLNSCWLKKNKKESLQ